MMIVGRVEDGDEQLRRQVEGHAAARDGLN
jgi:hypothetical protein